MSCTAALLTHLLHNEWRQGGRELDSSNWIFMWQWLFSKHFDLYSFHLRPRSSSSCVSLSVKKITASTITGNIIAIQVYSMDGGVINHDSTPIALFFVRSFFLGSLPCGGPSAPSNSRAATAWTLKSSPAIRISASCRSRGPRTSSLPAVAPFLWGDYLHPPIRRACWVDAVIPLSTTSQRRSNLLLCCTFFFFSLSRMENGIFTVLEFKVDAINIAG